MCWRSLTCSLLQQYEAAAEWARRAAHEPATAILSDGLYGVSRNPIYLGLTAIYLGVGVMADAGWVAVLLGPLLAVMHFGVIAREERYLERKFGDEYRRYKAKVRRWI